MKEIDATFLSKSALGLTNINVQPRKKKLPSNFVATEEDTFLLEQFRRYWEDLSDFRERRQRSRQYYRGRQWSDVIEDENGNYITEEDYIKNQGKVPLKQNIIRQLMKNLIGQLDQSPTKSMVQSTKRKDAKLSEMLTNTIRYNLQINHGKYLDTRTFEEYGLSGAPIHKIGFDYNDELNRFEGLVEKVDPRTFVFNTDVTDQRLKDLRMVGELVESTIDEMITSFASDKREEKIIRELYRDPRDNDFHETTGLDADETDDIDFFVPSDYNKCRFYEIWYKSSEWGVDWHDYSTGEDGFEPGVTEKDIEALNEERIAEAVETYGLEPDDVLLIEATNRKRQVWKYKYLTPHGYCLKEGVTPFLHNEHPYAFVLYPLLDGEVWGFVEDVIDQQRYINRLITLMDFIISAGAKGTWMIPSDAIDEAVMSKQEFIDELTKVGGVAFYKAKPQVAIPDQISNQSVPVGISELLSIQMQLVYDVSGVQPSIQGMPSKSGTPASLYAQEAQNASINVVDYMNTFSYFKQKRDLKLLKTIVQFYDEPRYLNISGVDYQKEAVEYDPDMVEDLDFDVVTSQSNDTPVYRQLMDDMLFKLLEMGMINVESYLENTSYPFADKLLETVRQYKQELMQGGAMDPNMMNNLNANPQSVNMLNQALNQPAA